MAIVVIVRTLLICGQEGTPDETSPVNDIEVSYTLDWRH